MEKNYNKVVNVFCRPMKKELKSGTLSADKSADCRRLSAGLMLSRFKRAGFSNPEVVGSNPGSVHFFHFFLLFFKDPPPTRPPRFFFCLKFHNNFNLLQSFVRVHIHPGIPPLPPSKKKKRKKKKEKKRPPLDPHFHSNFNAWFTSVGGILFNKHKF